MMESGGEADGAAGGDPGLQQLLLEPVDAMPGHGTSAAAPEVQLDRYLRYLFPEHCTTGSTSPGGGARGILLLSNLSEHLRAQCSAITAQATAAQPPVSGLVCANPGLVELEHATVPGGPCTIQTRGLLKNLGVESLSNFPSLRANAAVYSGRWIYEVVLETAGIQQLGWATNDCEFSHENGVGDSPNSYAYDGKRKKVWNAGPTSYGEGWVPGDVIGCAIDVDAGEVEYFRNGRSLGVAFRNVAAGPGFCYFPAISISRSERCRVNFGGTPIKSGVGAGYAPLQAPPPEVAVASYLLEAFERLLVHGCGGPAASVGSDGDGGSEAASSGHGESSTGTSGGATLAEAGPSVSVPTNLMDCNSQTLLTIIAAHTVAAIGPLLTMGYIVTDQFAPLLLRLSPQLQRRACGVLVSLCSPADLATCVGLLFDHLSHKCQESLPCDGGHRFADLARTLLECPRVLELWLSQPGPEGWHRQLEGLLSVKLSGNDDRDTILPDVYWTGCGREESKGPFVERVEQLKSSFVALEQAQRGIVATLLDTETHLTTVAGGISQTPHAFFRGWLQGMLRVNVSAAGRPQQPPGVADHTVLASLQSALMHAFVARMPKEASVDGDGREDGALDVWLQDAVKDSVFVTESVTHFELTRLGGLLSEVRRCYAQAVGEGSAPAVSGVRETPTPEFELMSRSSILYHLSLTQPYRRLQNAYKEARRALKDQRASTERLGRVKQTNEKAVALLQHAEEVFRQYAKENVQTAVLMRTAYLSEPRQRELQRWLDAVVRVLVRLQATPTFAFVPDMLVAVVISGFHALHEHGEDVLSEAVAPPFFSREETSRQFLVRLAQLLVAVLADDRVKTPDAAGNVLGTLRALLAVPEYVRVVEAAPVCQPLLKALLAAYEGRLWVTSTDVLVRFWAGSGYAFAPCSDVMESESEGNDIACASSLARQQFSNVCGTQPAMVNKFLNNLINNVNWTVSEFDQSLEEIRNASEADQEEGHDHFRRCALMFELTVNLLRLLEGVVTDGSTLFREGTPPEGCPEAGMNLERVTQLMVHMIERTVSNKLFESVTSAHLTALGGMRKELLLSPIFGTLMVLAGGGGAADSELGAHGMSSIVKCGRLKPKFIEGSGILTLAGLTDVDRDRLVNFQIRFTSAVEAHAALTPEPVDEDAEERTCTICYAGLLDVEFRPCNHRSCRKCITRHLLNDTKCFFCNAQVDLVVHDDGTEVYSREPDAAQ